MPSFRSPRGKAAAPGIRTARAKSRVSRVARFAVPVAAVTGLLAFQAAGVSAGAAGRSVSHVQARLPMPVPDLGHPINIGNGLPAPISTTDCLALVGIACYTPLQYDTAYNINALHNAGITGAGRTIVIVDSFGSPTIANDVAVFDAQFGLPAANLTVDQFGTIPPYDPTDATMRGWAAETTLDVEYAHAMAPGAKIVLAETPVAETQGTVGLPEMMNAEQSLIDQGVGDVITQSFGATENTFPGFDSGDFSSLLNLRYAFKDAFRHRVTVLASSGDDGATDADFNGDLFPMAVNSWPSSDPLVTSIGGTQLSLDNNGNRLSPDVVWNDGFGAGGGGDSAVFKRPLFQIGVRNVVGAQRGTPDISMSAAVNGAAWIYLTAGGFALPGWHLVGGTSEASPIFSGIVAMADQVAGHRLGDINPGLYALGALSRVHVPTGLVDVTSGNNSFAGVTGFSAASGYDMASGWGTIDANKFVHSLALVG
jgi:subtilase family serine protease